MKRLLVFYIISGMLLCKNVSPLLAKAPTTPKILFTSERDGNREVYIMNPDGSEQVNLTQHPADDLDAVWSPTGEQILFASNRNGVRDLYLMDPNGTNVRRIFKREVYREYPTWSPDGKQFAYTNVNFVPFTSTIYIATLGEQEVNLLVEGSFPAWSPDRTEIACSVSERLTLINIHTRAQKRVLPKDVELFQRFPSWSAEGDKLAFAWNKHPLPPPNAEKRVHNEWKDKITIYIVNRDGAGLQQLVGEAGPYSQYPALSPNGDAVLYTREINGRHQVFKVNVNDGIQTQLTHIVGLSLRQANIGGDWFDPAFALPVSPQPQLLTTTWGKLKQE